MNTEPGKKEIYQVVYTSHAVKEFSQEMLAALLEHSRHHNAVHDITGVLMHHDSFFAQCLEGPTDKVTALLERIAQDERHAHFAVVFEQTSAARAFPNWYMGCTAISDLEALNLSTVQWEKLEQTAPELNPASPGFVLLRSLWEAHSLDSDEKLVQK